MTPQSKPRKSEAEAIREDRAASFLEAYLALKGIPDNADEAERKARLEAFRSEREAFRFLLHGTMRKRLDAIGCRFHLHDGGGISVDRRLARTRDVAPFLDRRAS